MTQKNKYHDGYSGKSKGQEQLYYSVGHPEMLNNLKQQKKPRAYQGNRKNTFRGDMRGHFRAEKNVEYGMNNRFCKTLNSCNAMRQPKKKKRKKKIKKESIYRNQYEQKPRVNRHRRVKSKNTEHVIHSNRNNHRAKGKPHVHVGNDESRDTQDIASFFEISEQPNYLKNLPSLEQRPDNLLMNRQFMGIPGQTPRVAPDLNSYRQSKQRANPQQGMNLYQNTHSEVSESQEYSSTEREESVDKFQQNYERGAKQFNRMKFEFDESQLVEKTRSRLDSLSRAEESISRSNEIENNSENGERLSNLRQQKSRLGSVRTERNDEDEKSSDDDFRGILKDISRSSKRKRSLSPQITPLKKMRISEIKHLHQSKKMFIETINAESRLMRGMTITKPTHNLGPNAPQKSPTRSRKRQQNSFIKPGLCYSNEKPETSRVFVRSSQRLETQDALWDDFHEINQSKVLYTDDMNPNLRSQFPRFLDDLAEPSNRGQREVTRHTNVLLVGKAFRGKSDLLRQIFLDAFSRRVELEAEKVRKGNFELIAHQRTTRDFVSNFTFTDSRGFLSGLAVDDWFAGIKKYILQCMAEYHRLTRMVEQDASLRNRPIADSRIHLCLYLLQFPRLSANDYIYLKKLASHVNVLPVVIIKPEDVNKYSLSQIEAMKRQINGDLADLGLDCLQWARHDGVLKSLEKKLISRSFPAVVQLRSLDSNVTANRAANSDFHIILKMILNPYISYFQLRTERLYTQRLPRLIKEKMSVAHTREADSDDSENGEEPKEKFGIGAGVAVGLGLLGAIMAFKNKLF